MATLNKVMLIGNLTADPELRNTRNGNSVAELRLAVNRITNGPNEGERREEVVYINVTCWGRQAEVAGQYLAKGRPVFIEGRLQMETWDDRQTGQKRSRISVVAENLQLIGSRDGAPQGGGNGGYNQRPNNNYGNGGGYQPRQNNYGNGGGYQQGGNGGYQQPRPQQTPPPAPMEEEDDIPF